MFLEKGINILNFQPFLKHNQSFFLRMQLQEAKDKFIQCWGTLGSSWGINRTMAQIHSLLLISKETLCAEEIMSALNISRGNANMNLRALIDWGLVRKEHKPGERKEYFVAEKDIWEVTRRIMAERKKRELEPVIRVLDEVSRVEGGKNDEEVQEFREVVMTLKEFVAKLDRLSDLVSRSDRNWFYRTLMKVLG